MLSTTFALISFTCLASATDEGSAFGDEFPVVAPKRSKLTLRKPTPSNDASEDSAFGDVDYLKDVSSKPELRKRKPEPVQEESAFGDVDYLQDVVQNAHAAPSSKPALRKKNAHEYESAFGEKGDTLDEKEIQAEKGEKSDSLDEKKIQQLDEKESLVEESALGGELKGDAGDDLDDKDMKAESAQALGAMWKTKSEFAEDAEDDSAAGGEEHEHRSEEVRPSADAKTCTGAQCAAEKYSPVRNVHAYGPSGKPANWKPRNILGNRKELMAEEPARERGPRIYSRHMAVEHQSPQKRSLGEFVSSILDR